MRLWTLALAALLIGGCETQERQLITGLPTDLTFHAAALQKEVHVVRTEADVPHIFAATRHDAAYVLGFTTARDRFFLMDLARRAGTGTLSALLGEAALNQDQQARLSGITYVTDQLAAGLTPTLATHVDAYAQGVNDYIEAVKAEERNAAAGMPSKHPIKPPTEYEIAYAFLGAAHPSDLMLPFARRDIVAVVAYTIYQSSFETGDVGHAQTTQALPKAFNGVRDEALRKAGLDLDIWSPTVPIFQVASAPGLGTHYGSHPVTPGTAQLSSRLARIPPVSSALLTRLNGALGKQQVRYNRDTTAGYGSNAWAVAGFATEDGNAVMAGDGHLSLAIPPVLYQFGVDTTLFGSGDLHQLGLTIPGFPLMAIGTNGQVAWSQTQLGEDITDWYREIIQLDAHGRPSASRWGDEWKPLERIDEVYDLAPVLGAAGGQEVWSRYRTFDGRWLADFEGKPAKRGDATTDTETLTNGLSGYVIPGDEDGDGTITAVSFVYAGHFAGQLLSATEAIGQAKDVEAFREATKGLVAYSQNFAVSDATGNILYTSYEPIPCRRNLPRNPDGTFIEGADPTLLLDGTKYGAWSIPIKDGKVDESIGASDAAQCVVPFDKTPQSVNPDTGYVVTCNNDPGGTSFDNSIFNDEVYLGGPWDQGFRADTIGRALRKDIAAGRVGVASMQKVQANVDSRLGEIFVDHVLAAIAHAKAPRIESGNVPAELRLNGIYRPDAGAFDEIATRFTGWRDRGYQARGGVATFYRTPSATDIDDSIATMIFNAWIRAYLQRVFGDEGIDDIWGSIGNERQTRVLKAMLEGRGPGGQALLGSWEPMRGESVFFDDLRTPDVIETSDEDIMNALADALAFLRGPPDKVPGDGGFGTADMSKWLWGLRHQVEFKSLLADFFGPDDSLAIITKQLQIDTSVLPLLPPGETFAPDDPRANLEWFPRDGDQNSVDAANPGLGGSSFHHGSGSVMRMVFELSPSGVRGSNIIPGGQSGLTSSPHFTDQLRLWLQNTAYPVRFSARAVADGATFHEVFLPSGS
jgi:penicillin amidase